MKLVFSTFVFLLLFSVVATYEVAAQQGSIASVYGEAMSNQAAQATGGLVTCDGLDCDFCKLGEMANNIINWLFGFLIVLAVLVFAWAGFRLVTEGGSTEAVSWAKARFTNVVIGLLLMLAAWLIVDTILQGLTRQGLSFWGRFEVSECGSMTEPRPVPYDEFDPEFRDTTPESGYTRGPDDGLRGSSPGDVAPGDLVSYGGKQFHRSVVGRVRNLAETYGLTVTSGYRSPQHNADVGGVPTSWHLTGRAADFVGTESAMQAAANAARQQGAIEVLIHNVGSGRHLHVVW